ncbi:hypothetical protein DLB57_22325 [Salmonella enterica subsp. enterica serovar Typhimurium]|nr:hypothetical protein [Salmonella enterica subsp. enterica serovar Typhimurium]EBY8246127.1 hypothetical protein [Salmonella enterica subsp. enterica serovar Typhimurium]EJQ6358648.1 hypothetical protein [Salmonella enterica]HAE4739022.1 hypothetical protein [Salmonella enterica subsp. houtenae serovar 41:z4,z23:-]
MQISDVVNDWCRKRNATTRANWWLLGLLLAWAAGIGWISYNRSLLGLVLIVGAAMAWNLFAPKPESLASFRRAGRNRYVPDSLLASLADAPTVPVWVKTAVADALKEDGRITFESLFDMEGWIADGEARELRAQGRGFQKMTAFGSKPTKED